MLTFGDRVARLGLSALIIVGICLYVRSAFGPNALMREISRAIDQDKISKTVVFSCGAILIEVMPDDPAMIFHEGNMNGATSDICNRKEYSKTDNDIATTVESKIIFEKLEQFAHNSRWNFLVWSPFPQDIIGYGFYLYEQESHKVFAIYVSQFPEQRGGAVASWRYADSKWALDSLEYTMSSDYYIDAKELIISIK